MGTVQLALAGLDFEAPKPPRKATARRKRRPKRVVDAAAPVEYSTGVDADGRTQWTLRFPAPDRMLSGNNDVYWRTRHSLTKSFREAMVVHAKAAKLPVGLARVRLSFELRFATARNDRDALNYHTLVVKPSVDGLGPAFHQVIKRGKRAGQTNFQPGHGLIANDTPEFLDGPYITLGPKVEDPKRCPFGEIVLVVTDLSEVAA